MIPNNIYNLSSQIKEICEQLKIAERTVSYQWFCKKGIDVAFRGTYFLLTKNENSSINHWNMLCNSLLIKEKHIPIAIPWFHFQSLNKSPIDFYDCQAIESIDGLEIHVCSDGCNGLVAHSKQKTSNINPDLKDILQLIRKIKFNISDMDYTWTFRYLKENTFYLMAAKCLRTYAEFDERDLDLAVDRFKCSEVKVLRPETLFITKGIKQVLSEINLQVKNYKSQKKWIIRDCGSCERTEIDIDNYVNDTGTRWRDLVSSWLSLYGYNNLLNMYPKDRIRITDLNKKVEKKITEIFKCAESVLEKTIIIGDIENTCSPEVTNITKSLLTSHKEKWSSIIEINLRKLGTTKLMEMLDIKD